MTTNSDGIGIAFVIVGAIVWVLAYLNHERGSGTIRAPDPLRRLLRRGTGPLKLSSVTNQVMAVIVAVTGAAVAAGLVAPNAILRVGAPAVLIAIGIDVALSLRDRRSRK